MMSLNSAVAGTAAVAFGAVDGAGASTTGSGAGTGVGGSATAGAVASIPPVRHRVDQIAQFGDQLFCRFTIEVAAEGGTVVMPCVTVIWLAPDSGSGAPKIIDYRVHMDISPALVPPPA